jgi:hypothetical protein
MKMHQRDVHQERVGRGRRSDIVEWESTWCQTFFKSVGNRYFRVQRISRLANSEARHTLLQLVHRQLDEKERKEQEKRCIIRESDNATEISPWLERTEWIYHLARQDKSAMVKLIRPAQNEELELQEVQKSIIRLVEKARETVLQRRVSIFTLQRLESFQSGQDAPKPFHVNMQQDTLRRYQRVWQQLLVYVVRTADTESRLYRLTQQQQNSIQQVKSIVQRFQQEELDEEGIETLQEDLDICCLQLCIMLLHHQLERQYDSAVISCLAVMSLEQLQGSEQYRFKDPTQYTPILSGFIKVAQMLTLQYCFEQEDDGEVKSCRQLLEQLHSQFLTVGTSTPMDWALRLRLYGRGIGKRMTAEGCINWVGETVIYEDIELSMIDFRRMIHKLADETRAILLDELLFDDNNAGK